MDMFDGGGAGQMGDTFQGGGLFSLIANMVADPYGSKDPERRKERMKALGLLDTGMDMSKPPAAPTVAPVLRPEPKPNMNALDPFGGAGPNVTGAAAERGMGLDPFGGAGPNVTGVAAERGMGLGPFGGAGEQFMNQVRGDGGNRPMLSGGQPTVEEMKNALDRKFANNDFSEFDLSDPRDAAFIKRLYEGHIVGAANRQPAGTPTSMYEPNPEDLMRQKMRNAGYDPTGLGVHEMQLFIDAMGL